MLKQRLWISGSLLSLLILLLTSFLVSCSAPDGKQSPSTAQHSGDPANSTTETEQVAATPEIIWKRCNSCHSRKSLSGVSSQDISNAIKNVPAMNSFASSLSIADIDNLARLLSGELKEKYSFVSVKKCRNCHQQHVEQWKHSLHALAHSEPVYDYYFIQASKDSNQELETYCASCHTPIGVYNGTIPFAKAPTSPAGTKVSDIESDGLQCDFCHVISGYSQLFNAGYELNPSNTKYGPYKNSVSSFHGTEFSELHKSSKICGTCHNVNHPVNGIVLESTYTEWSESNYALEGIQCQDCHMTDALEPGSKQPGLASSRGQSPKRENVSSHYFVGPNLLYANEPGARELGDLSRQLLKKAGVVEIIGAGNVEGGIEVVIKISNTGCGHYLPTGVTEIRELWLDVVATNSSGDIVFHSGALDTDGNLSPGTVVFRTEVLDAKGKSTTLFWNTEKKLWDKRIPPNDSLTEKLLIPNRKTGDLNSIHVDLKYRSVSPFGLKEAGAPETLVAIPEFIISSAQMQF